MRLDIRRRFLFPLRLCKALKGVSGLCQVCPAVKRPHRAQAGNADWTPLPEVPTSQRTQPPSATKQPLSGWTCARQEGTQPLSATNSCRPD